MSSNQEPPKGDFPKGMPRHAQASQVRLRRNAVPSQKQYL